MKTTLKGLSDNTIEGLSEVLKIFTAFHENTKSSDSRSIVRIASTMASGIDGELSSLRKVPYKERIEPVKKKLRNKIDSWLINLDFFLKKFEDESGQLRAARKLLETSINDEIELVATNVRSQF